MTASRITSSPCGASDDPTGNAPKLKHEAIYLDAERSSGLLYWTGKKFEIYSTHD